MTSPRRQKLCRLADREVRCSDTEETVRVNSSREEHHPCDLVHDEHANHCPCDMKLSRMFVVTTGPRKIDVKAVALEVAFLSSACDAKTSVKQEVSVEPASYTFLSMLSSS